MRLGGPVFQAYDTPETWVAQVREAGYRAAYCPVGRDAPEADVARYAAAAAAADITLAEVGAWSNPLSPDDATRRAAVATCKRSLDLAERIGARCCVNIAGSRGAKWDGPLALDAQDDTFAMIVDMVRDIIDSVRPRRTFYTLETMPWMLPDSADAYVALLEAVDRPAFGVHFDPVNLINSPQRYFRNAAVISDFVARLGPHIRSCHAKDIRLQDRLTVHLDEVPPGQGGLDYAVFLREVAGLAGDVPVMLEHLPDAAAYTSAAAHIREVASREGIRL